VNRRDLRDAILMLFGVISVLNGRSATADPGRASSNHLGRFRSDASRGVIRRCRWSLRSFQRAMMRIQGMPAAWPRISMDAPR